MGWQKISARPTNTRVHAAAMVKVTPGRQRGRQRLLVTFRVADLPRCAWIRPGRTAQPFIGDGEDRGKLRVDMNGEFIFRGLGPKSSPARVAVSLFMPLPDAINPGAAGTVRVPAEIVVLSEKSVEITLPPAWFGDAARTTKAPFRTAATTGPAPIGLAGGR